MAKFTDLPNELVIAVASHTRKPGDILQLCIAERRSHHVILPLLYENIVLHHLDYSIPEDNGVLQLHSLKSNISSLCQLFKQQQQNAKTGNGQSADFGAECRSLSINMLDSVVPTTSIVCKLLNFIPFLKNLSVVISRRSLGYLPDWAFGLDKLGRVLYPMRDTLEILTLFIGRYEGNCSNVGVGSLHRFNALKKLHIQSQALIGCEYDKDSIFGYTKAESMLSQLLPPKLEKLAIHCCEIDWRNREGEIAHHFEEPSCENSAQLFRSSQRSVWRNQRVIENVFVCMLEEPKTRYSSFVLAARSLRLENCFDIVGRNMDSANEDQLE